MTCFLSYEPEAALRDATDRLGVESAAHRLKNILVPLGGNFAAMTDEEALLIAEYAREWLSRSKIY